MPDKSDGKLKAILVEAVLDRREGDHLSELSELARVSGYEVVDKIVPPSLSNRYHFFTNFHRLRYLRKVFATSRVRY